MISQKYALVTGGCSGIGKEIAIQLAKSGISVCINYSKSEKNAIETQKEIQKEGGTAIIFQADVSKEEEVKRMFNFIRDEYGYLDVLVNNAGIDIYEELEQFSYENWKNILEVNLNGKFLCSKESVALLKKSSHPRIINISSICANKYNNETSAYCCSQSGIITLTKCSALELSKYNIKVNAISPALTRTPINDNCTEEDFENYANSNPSHRLGKVTDISNMVLFLISEQGEFINGENINVSGGMILK